MVKGLRVENVYTLDLEDASISGTKCPCVKNEDSEVDKTVTRKGAGGLNCDLLKIILQLKINSQVVCLEYLS